MFTKQHYRCVFSINLNFQFSKMRTFKLLSILPSKADSFFKIINLYTASSFIVAVHRSKMLTNIYKSVWIVIIRDISRQLRLSSVLFLNMKILFNFVLNNGRVKF